MARRFYVYEAGTVPFTPNVDGSWVAVAAPFARRPLVTSPFAGDTLTQISAASTSGNNRCYRQCISEPMLAGFTFNTGVTYKAYFQALEGAANDNCISRCGIRILSEDTGTVRHTVLAVADYSTGTEWNTARRNKAFLNGDAGTGSYTTVKGDRLCFEIGHNDTAGTTPTGSLWFGSQATGVTDLPENETSTSTTERGWFECSLDIMFDKDILPAMAMRGNIKEWGRIVSMPKLGPRGRPA